MIVKITFNSTVASKRGYGSKNVQKQFVAQHYVFQMANWKSVKRFLKHMTAFRNARLDIATTAVALKPRATKLMTVKEVCEYLNISERTSRRWRHDNKLPFIKKGCRVLFNQYAISHLIKPDGHVLSNPIENYLAPTT